MRAFAVLATLLTVALVGPALVLAYVAVLGGDVTSEQSIAAFVLLLAAVPIGAVTVALWEGVADRG